LAFSERAGKGGKLDGKENDTEKEKIRDEEKDTDKEKRRDKIYWQGH
jgi:hypothetical protein